MGAINTVFLYISLSVRFNLGLLPVSRTLPGSGCDSALFENILDLV
jgi:hypothetical protein